MVDGGSWLKDRTAIVGIGHTRFGKRGELSANGSFPLVLEALLKACADAGLSPKLIDGFASYSNDPAIAGRLSLAIGAERLCLSNMTWGGGGGGMSGAFLAAAMAVATGQADYVAVTRGVIQPTGGRYGTVPSYRKDGLPVDAFPVLSSPGQAFALAARRHMHEFGTTTDHFAEVVINSRLNAATNPNARFRDPITLDDYYASRLMADPLRMFDFCMESDVAACCIVTTTERAADLQQIPAYIAAVESGAPRRWGGGHFWMAEGGGTGYQQAPADITSAGHRPLAERLYRNAGLTPQDIRIAEIYDHFSPMVLMALEDYGFVKPGESGPFAAEGNIRRDGALPVNTHGGNLAEVYAHGMTHVIEAVRQIRGISPNQIDNADVVLVAGGSSPSPSGGLILTHGTRGRAA